MLKKLVAISLITVPLSSWAAAWGNGFYLGAGIAADTTHYQINSYPQKAGDFSVINKTEEGAQGVLGNLFAGYGWSYQWFYLAAELNGNLSSARAKTSNQELVHNSYSQTIYKINQSWGVGLLPGILLPETTLLYGRVGYVDGNFHTNTSDSSLVNANTWLSGLRLGVGLEKRVYKNVGLRLEYSHISYRQQSSTASDPSIGFTKTTDIKPNSNQFELAVDYRFPG